MERGEQNVQEVLRHVQNIRRNLLSTAIPPIGNPSNLFSSQNVGDEYHNQCQLFPCGELIDSIKHSMESVGSYINKLSHKKQYPERPILYEVEHLLEDFDSQSDLLETMGIDEEYQDLKSAYEQILLGSQQKTISKSKGETPYTDADIASIPVLDSLVEVKRDKHYELFFITNEDNKKFYTDSLSQIITKHGKLYENTASFDPLTKTILWQGNEKERQSHYLFATSEAFIRDFYKSGALKAKMIPEIAVIHKAITALLLSRQSKTMIASKPVKSNIAYFNDFLGFLRESIVLLEESHPNVLEKEDLRVKSERLVNEWVSSFFHYRSQDSEAIQYLFSQMNISMEGRKVSINKYIADLYDEQHKLFSKFPNGPLLKSVDYLFDKSLCQQFDPFKMGMTPSLEGKLIYEGKVSVKVLSSANPIVQKSVLYASLNQEFLALLNILKKEGSSVLIVNFQNRRSKKDRARTRLLEECANSSEYAQNIVVFSCPEPEDLLLNIEGSEEIKDFHVFVQAVLEEILKEGHNSSYSMESSVKDKLEKKFFADCLFSLKEIFFAKKKILFRNDKLLLLHLISYLLVFKQLEIISPNYLWVMSKDGLDYVESFLAGLCFFSRKSVDWDERSLKLLFAKLSASTFLMRDRQVLTSSVELLEKLVSSLRKNRKNLSKLSSRYKCNLEGWEFDGFIPEVNEG